MFKLPSWFNYQRDRKCPKCNGKNYKRSLCYVRTTISMVNGKHKTSGYLLQDCGGSFTCLDCGLVVTCSGVESQ